MEGQDIALFPAGRPSLPFIWAGYAWMVYIHIVGHRRIEPVLRFVGRVVVIASHIIAWVGFIWILWLVMKTSHPDPN